MLLEPSTSERALRHDGPTLGGGLAYGLADQRATEAFAFELVRYTRVHQREPIIAAAVDELRRDDRRWSPRIDVRIGCR